MWTRQPRLAAERDHQPDRVVLPVPRPRGQVPRIAPAFGGVAGCRRDVAADQLGVDEQRQPGAGQLGHDGAEVGLGRVRELVDPRVAEERLEAERRPAAIRAPTCPLIAGHDAAVEAAIDPELARGGLDLERQGLGRRRDGRAVERHVDQRGDPARGGGAGRRGESFPLGPPGLVDVDVGIDQPRQDDPIAHVLDPAGAGQIRRARRRRRSSRPRPRPPPRGCPPA